MDGPGTECRRNTDDNLNRLSRAHERYRQSTDRRQSDGRQHIANVNVSSRSLMIKHWLLHNHEAQGNVLLRCESRHVRRLLHQAEWTWNGCFHGSQISAWTRTPVRSILNGLLRRQHMNIVDFALRLRVTAVCISVLASLSVGLIMPWTMTGRIRADTIFICWPKYTWKLNPSVVGTRFVWLQREIHEIHYSQIGCVDVAALTIPRLRWQMASC